MQSASGKPALAFLETDTIVRDPIEYLNRIGLHIAHFDHEVLSDYGLGPPVIRYRVRDGDGCPAKTFIAKWHEPEHGLRLFTLLRALWDAGFTDDQPLCISEPLQFITESHILLQSEACGVPLYHRLCELGGVAEPDANALVPVRLAARWLAQLHSLADFETGYRQARTAHPTDSLSQMRMQHDALGAMFPAHATRFERLAQMIENAFQSQRGYARVPTHGDYHPKNIYISDGRVTVIDFDRFAMSAAERDVSYFLVQSMTMAYSQSHTFQTAARWNAAFVDAYQQCGMLLNPTLLRVFWGVAFFEVLYYRLCVRPVPDRAFIAEWLSHCEQFMADPTPV